MPRCGRLSVDKRPFLSGLLPRSAKDALWVFKESRGIFTVEIGQVRLRDRAWHMDFHQLRSMAFNAAEPNALRRVSAWYAGALVQSKISFELPEEAALLVRYRVPGSP